MVVQHLRGARLSTAARLTAGHVGELVREIAPLVAGLTLREVLARPPRDVLLVFAKPGDADGPPTWRVMVSADGDAPRLHVQRAGFERHAGPLGPFFRRLAAELAGLEVRALTQVAGDRIVALELRPSAAAGAGAEPRTLIAELVGRHSNLMLLGPGQRVLDVLVPPPADKADPRIVVGREWVPPTGRALKPGAEAAELAQSLPQPDTAPLRKHETSNPAPLSWIVECALGTAALEAYAARERRDLTDRLDRKRKNARSLVLGLERRLAASAEAGRVREDGELLKANLAHVVRGAKTIDVADFFAPDAPTRTIALDPKLSPHENMERTFERARKLERSSLVVAEELEMARAKLSAIEALLSAANVEGADLEALEQQAIAERVLEPQQPTTPAAKKREAVAPRVPYKVFQGLGGAEIRVGRSARDNDDLTFHHANGNDVWLHTADTPGSHVVLRTQKGAEPHPEDLLDAAHLAVHFSPLKSATRARVHIARRKEVHKPRGAKPGLVTLSGGKILDVRVQPPRLQRLLGTHRPSPDGG